MYPSNGPAPFPLTSWDRFDVYSNIAAEVPAIVHCITCPTSVTLKAGDPFGGAGANHIAAKSSGVCELNLPMRLWSAIFVGWFE